MLGPEPLDGLDIHPTRLGAWKHEYDFIHAKYVRPKCYAEMHADGTHTIRIAGLPASARSGITVDTLQLGGSYPGKLRPMRVPGGVCLVPVEYVIH